MNFNAILPFMALIVGIYLVSRVRIALAGYAMFRPQTSPLLAFERLARGVQIAMLTLLVIGTASTAWKEPFDWRPPFATPRQKEPAHVIIPTEFPPTAISPTDPYWLQREMREAMLMWEARSRPR